MSVRLGFIVPTKDRPKELNRLLKSMYEQDFLPETIIIVDGSAEQVENGLIRDSRVQIIYTRVFPPSLTAQRNRGIAAIPDGLTHVGFLDDDIVLLPGCLKEIVSYLDNPELNLGGASFNIVEDHNVSAIWLLRFLGLFPKRPGTVSRGGSVQANVNIHANMNSQFLCGGATVWRSEVLKTFKFDEFFKGYALWEDVDFSYRVSKKWPLMVIKNAKVLHLHIGAVNPAAARYYGDVEVVDRFYFCKKHAPATGKLAAAWATFGTIFRNLVSWVRSRQSMHFVRAISNFNALCRCLAGNLKRKVLPPAPKG